MSTTPQEDWRTRALEQMEQSEQAELSSSVASSSMAVVVAKLIFLAVLSLFLVLFLGYGWLVAVLFVGWYLFWPR